MTADALAKSTDAKDLLRVTLDGVAYAIEVRAVREIINPLSTLELPCEDPSVLGVSDYRNHVLVVVDLRRLFGLPAVETSRTKWVVLRNPGNRLVAIVVDAVVDVFSSHVSHRRPVPELDSKHAERGIEWAVKHEDGLVFVLSTERLSQPAQRLSKEALDAARSP